MHCSLSSRSPSIAMALWMHMRVRIVWSTAGDLVDSVSESSHRLKILIMSKRFIRLFPAGILPISCKERASGVQCWHAGLGSTSALANPSSGSNRMHVSLHIIYCRCADIDSNTDDGTTKKPASPAVMLMPFRVLRDTGRTF